jgi:hypothetical protein
MPAKYHIKTVGTAGRFRRVGKYASVDLREDCSRCTNCVKPRCVYDTYRKDAAHARDPESSVQPLYDCRACFSCVQGCTKGLLSLCVNPEFLALGDDYFTPTILDSTWKQADTGRVPVSGAGYRGRFHGPGFDSIWTDMSEIVRPTRDGIHGREYISTSVDVGTKPMRLRFGDNGELLGEVANLIELPIPAVLDIPPWETTSLHLTEARLVAAAALHTLAIVPWSEIEQVPAARRVHTVPLITAIQAAAVEALLERVRMVEIIDGPLALTAAIGLLNDHPETIVALRTPLGPANQARIVECARAGVKVFHLAADLYGREYGVVSPRHVKDVLREIHGGLVAAGIRDEVTLIVGGGIALAEHMAKAIICGADLVALDTALLVALGCRVCHGSDSSASHDCCPAEIGQSDTGYAAQRLVNLVGAWHSQLIEVLGAMGIREVRRLRGEVGRAIFMEDIEREAFGDLVHKHQ